MNKEINGNTCKPFDLDVEISSDLNMIPELAKKAEEFGYDGIFVNETKHDAFVQATLVSVNTRKIKVGTGIAVAFPRSPTVTAYSAWDIQKLSGGRFILGLGSQVKGHIERRFGLKWESPVEKMREYILAIRSIWDNWQGGKKLDFSGKFYRINLMTDFFNPGRIPNPAIPIFLACVNQRMYKLGYEICDGILVHPFHTEKYLETMLNSLKNISRQRKNGFTISVSCFVATGENEEEINKERRIVKKHIAFYASARTYSNVLKQHGLESLSNELHKLSIEGKWEEMEKMITDEILELFLVSGKVNEVSEAIIKRYAGKIHRLRFYSPFDGREKWKKIIQKFES